MSVSYNKFLAACVALCAIAGAMPAFAAQTITYWGFDNAPALALDINPAPTTGVGSAIPLGMNNSYVLAANGPGSQDGEDLIATAGSSTTSLTDQAWRVRGNTANVYIPTPALSGNGWSTHAPEYTQGAQFNVDTTGFTNVVFSFDWFSTNQGVRDGVIQYTTDGSTWNTVQATGVSSGGVLGTSIAVNGGGGLFYNINNANSFVDGLTVDFGSLGITSVENDPNFGVRFVSIYDPTTGGHVGDGLGGTTYTASAAGTTYPIAVNGAYNNSSGNWRFDNVLIAGTSTVVPEPSTFVLVGLGLVAVSVGRLRRSK
jgi:hypothetical protein